jgi:beta-phosphoglucomutase-like phosphatase (HAD superfamily)
MIKALLLDWNGIIINDEPLQMRIYQEILAKEGIALTDADYYSCLGMDDRRFVEAAYSRAGQTPQANKVLEIIENKTEAWREAISNDLPLFPGIENFLYKAAKDLSLGIVSMCNHVEIDHVLETTGLGELFTIVVSAEDVSAAKPVPECYRLGFNRLDAARTTMGHLPMTHPECVVIEDSPAGVQAAVAAYLQVLGVTNTVSADELRATGALWIAKDLNDWWPESIRLAFAR